MSFVEAGRDHQQDQDQKPSFLGDLRRELDRGFLQSAYQVQIWVYNLFLEKFYHASNMLPSPWKERVRREVIGVDLGSGFTKFYLALKDPSVVPALSLSQERKLPEKGQLELWAEADLRLQTRLHLSKEETRRRLGYPDLPQPQDVFYNLSALSRLFVGRYLSCPIFGFTDQYVRGEREHYIGKPNLDHLLLDRIYPSSVQEEQRVHDRLTVLFQDLLNKEIPQPDQQIIDNLRFLGLKSEEEFIEKTEKELLFSMEEEGVDATKIREVIRFAKEMSGVIEETKADEDGIGKRRTGESYYCHYLASAFLLWSMFRPFLERADEGERKMLVDSVEVMFLHDLGEELEIEERLPDAEKEETTLIFKTKIDRRYQYVLNNTQIQILDNLTKKDGEGRSWFEKQITGVKDSQIKKWTASCKAADRLSNLLTMTCSPGRSYLEVYRKLLETILTGGQLMWMAQGFSHLSPIQARLQLQKIGISPFVTSLASIPIIAEMERQILLSRFGEDFYSQIRKEAEKKEKWAEDIVTVVEQATSCGYRDLSRDFLLDDTPWNRRAFRYLHGQKEVGGRIPPWAARVSKLIRHYHLEPGEVTESTVPALLLSDSYGLRSFARRKSVFDRRGKPVGFYDLKQHLIIPSWEFFNTMVLGRGVLPGGRDDVWWPKRILFC